jgi:hypothetical protein
VASLLDDVEAANPAAYRVRPARKPVRKAVAAKRPVRRARRAR